MNQNGVIKKTILQPIGLVLALLPYDFPVLEAILRLVPAVLAGNSVLLKSSKDTPLMAEFICQAFDDVAPGLAQSFFVDYSDTSFYMRDIEYLTYAGSYQSSLGLSAQLAENDFIQSDMDVGGLNFAYIGASCIDN